MFACSRRPGDGWGGLFGVLGLLVVIVFFSFFDVYFFDVEDLTIGLFIVSTT